ncbi:hypothetical protein GTO89_04465 [Heliobacterium gestii]|uniref:SpoOB alpha-helical domain-containing protein n=1 Tax=Heliomicrobium gestii TaxID=2699 RepID=A0A845LAG9_HELGE|nr:Spo0B domain-containing protein [Heliomicrobium gestii]MBM7866866.1 hypothetical protein [Heliomicrobium gestii]MZP42294.1 hypothetical protein [Heliomicrobium gestii]
MAENGLPAATDRHNPAEGSLAQSAATAADPAGAHFAGFSPDTAEWVELWRELRHDFINHLQTILGYIQVGRGERSLEYLREVALRLQEDGGIMRLGVLPVIAHLLLRGQDLRERAVDLRIGVDQAWNPEPWQEENCARRLASAASGMIEALLPSQDPSEEEPALCLRFRGPDPVFEGCWLGRDETLKTVDLVSLLQEGAP